MKNSKIIIPAIIILIIFGVVAVSAMKGSNRGETTAQSMEESHGHSH